MIDIILYINASCKFVTLPISNLDAPIQFSWLSSVATGLRQNHTRERGPVFCTFKKLGAADDDILYFTIRFSKIRINKNYYTIKTSDRRLRIDSNNLSIEE